MIRVRFAPSPTGSLHLGSALSAVANRAFADEHGGMLLLRIDDTDLSRNVPGGEEALLRDLEWLGVCWDEGPARQSERAARYAAAAERLEQAGRTFRDANGALRFDRERRPTLLRPDGTATYHLASVVDDVELGVTHVIRGKDHLPNTPLHEELARALAADPPEYLHHGLLLGDDGQKLSKRHGLSSLAELRDAGIPAEALRRYLEELGLPRGDVHADLARVRRHAIDAIAGMPAEELARRVGVDLELVPALRGARDLNEACEFAHIVLAPEPVPPGEAARATLERFRELRERAEDRLDADAARAIVRELKAVGGDLRALRLALTGRDRGPELWTVLAAIDREEAIRRAHTGSNNHK
ncbi:MAG: glutamate--tRNA ligase [Gaiellaceae bacterium]